MYNLLFPGRENLFWTTARACPKVHDLTHLRGVFKKFLTSYFSKIFNLCEPKYLSSTMKIEGVTIETLCKTMLYMHLLAKIRYTSIYWSQRSTVSVPRIAGRSCACALVVAQRSPAIFVALGVVLAT